ncbi:MAG: DMT family transporter [Bacteroidales bacterium]|nr:DMT family transporter [Bacteroidales bacterium]
MKNNGILPHLTALIAMIIWGGSYVWSTQVFQTLQPGTTVLLRLLISCPFLLLLSFLFKTTEKIEKKDIKLFFLAAFFEPFLYFIGESYGLLRVSPTICSAIVATIPLFAPIAAFFMLKERISAMNIVGLIVSFLGVLLMLFNKNLEMTASVSGLLFIFMAVVVAVCYSVALKKLADRYHPITVVLVENSIGIIYFLPFVLLMECTSLPAVLQVSNYIVPLLLLAILASSISYVLYTYSVGKLGVARSNVYTNTIPIFTACFSYFLIHEEITVFKMIGIVVVILGLILSQIKAKKP